MMVVKALNREASKRAWSAPRFDASTLQRITPSSFVIATLTVAIRIYQLTISPAQVFLFGPGAGCRFTPTCSEYAIQAIRARGALAGGWLALKRIGRCHPWGSHGHDPAPLGPRWAERGRGFSARRETLI